MWLDEIVEEVRAIRDAHAAHFGYDLDAIYQDLKNQEQQSGRRVVILPPKRVKRRKNAHTKPETITSPSVPSPQR